MPYLPDLAALRTEVFFEWPYLYVGSRSYESEYLRGLGRAERAAVIAAFAGDKVVGMATCLPLSDEPDNVQQPFLDHGLNPRDYFYFGESVLRKEYRGRGVGVAFFAAREAQARKFGDYKFAAFCAVQRPDDHPLKPTDFVPLDAFWGKRGYTKQPHLTCQMSWLDRGETEKTFKPLTFWTKAL